MKVQAVNNGFSNTACGGQYRHKGDVFDWFEEKHGRIRANAWVRRVPDDTPSITDGEGYFYEKEGISYITHTGQVVARFIRGGANGDEPKPLPLVEA